METTDWKEINSIVGELLHPDEELELLKAELPITFINDIQVNTDSEALSLRDKLTIKYTTDVINFDEGINPIEQPIMQDTWIRTPEGVDWYMHPAIRLMLESKTRLAGRGGREEVNVLSYFCDPTYRLPTGYVPDKRFKKLLDAEIPRGINDFYHHFDEFIDIWFNISNRRGGYTYLSEPIYDLIQKYRDRVFVKHLPMYSNHIFAIEATDNLESMDKSVIQHALDAVYTLTSLDMEIKALTPKRMQAKAWKVNTCMCLSVKAYLDEVFLKKEGLIRKSNCGTPSSFNTRCVITSNQRRNASHRHLIIPWGVAMVLFAQEITGILMREYKYSITQIFHMRAKYAKQFNQQLYDIIQRFLKAHRRGGKTVILHRPPTLERGSHQVFDVPDVEKDPRINAIQMPNSTTRPFNADFDGDELTATVLHDYKMEDLFERLRPHHGILDLNAPLEISSSIGITKSAVVKLEKYLNRHKARHV